MPHARRLAAVLALLLSVGPVRADVKLDKLTELHDLVMDPMARFSASAVLGQLETIDAPEGSRDRGRVEHLRSIIEMKIDKPAEAIRDGQAALAIDAAQPFLTRSERLHLEYDVAKLDVDAKECASAIPHYRAALALMGDVPSLTEDQRLGTQQQIAFCLHETKDYAGARALNADVLAAGERLHGATSPLLMTVLTNLGQNQYALGDHTGARASLERVLKIATDAGDQGRIDSMLFQLGVLAFEDGRKDEAKALMTRRLALAKASGDADRIAAAQADLDELDRRLRQ